MKQETIKEILNEISTLSKMLEEAGDDAERGELVVGINELAEDLRIVQDTPEEQDGGASVELYAPSIQITESGQMKLAVVVGHTQTTNRSMS